MIKFKITHPDTKRIIFGMVLTEGNIELLRRDKPIHFNAEDLNLPYIKCQEIFILYYKDNETALKDLIAKGYVDKDTKIEEIEFKRH